MVAKAREEQIIISTEPEITQHGQTSAWPPPYPGPPTTPWLLKVAPRPAAAAAASTRSSLNPDLINKSEYATEYKISGDLNATCHTVI